MRQQVFLLQLEHLQVFGKYLALPFPDRGSQRRILRLEFARHTPEIPNRGLGLGGDEVDHYAVSLEVVGCVVAAMPRMRHPHFDHDVAWRREMANLPTVDRYVISQFVSAQRHLPKRRRSDVLHKTAGGDVVTLGLGDARHFVDFLLANRAGVYIGFVGQVHQVIDHQSVITGNVIQTAAIGPSGVVEKLKLRNQIFTGLVSLSWPHPHKAITLDHRKATDRRKAPDTLAWHGDGFTLATHL